MNDHHDHDHGPPEQLPPAHTGSLPADHQVQRTHEGAPVILAPYYKDPVTGELFLHRDMFRSRGPWEEEAHVSPTKATERFGDVEAFAAYVKRYGVPERTFLTWNMKGIGGTLDYHTLTAPDRAQWKAFYPFVVTRQWEEWAEFVAELQSQREAVDFLEDHANEIAQPDSATLMTLLRSLKAWSTANAETEYREDGTAKLSFQKDQGVSARNGGAEVELPSSIKIAIPLIVGHPDTLGLTVRIRVSPEENRVFFRFSIPRADDVFEELRGELAAKAAAALGDEYTILRAAD